MEITHKYDDIINLPHHVSETRAHMPMLDRAAQFSPFAALTGYDAAVVETARLTDQKLELDETQKEHISEQLFELQERISEQPEATVVYFVPDEKKAGGAYETASGKIRKIDEYSQVLSFTDGTEIPFDSIYLIQSEALRMMENE